MVKAPSQMSRHNERLVAIWLFVIAGFVTCMVVVGGLTRLTDSGLSITEWQPILGVIPPLSHQDWLIALEKYRKIPEYQLINKGMSLEDFQFIYWWEWGHRFLGRIIGIVFLIPFLFFLFTKRLSVQLIWPLLALFILGGLQGAMGWYMVKSGLVDRLDVSQYRLAAHFSLALVIFAYSLWLGLSLWRQGSSVPAFGRRVVFGGLIVVCIFLQAAMGAFVAGTDAGMTYNTWPLIDGQVIPSGLYGETGGMRDAFEHHLTIQFNHRMMAYFLIILVLAEVFLNYRRGEHPQTIRSAGYLGISVVVQSFIGILTLLWVMPIELAALHQFMAVIVLGFGILHLNNLRFHRQAIASI